MTEICIYCDNQNTSPNGSRSEGGHKLWHCRDCNKWFSENQIRMRMKEYQAYGYFHRMPDAVARRSEPKKKPIITISSIARKLLLSRSTVIKLHKKWLETGKPNPRPLPTYYRISPKDLYPYSEYLDAMADSAIKRLQKQFPYTQKDRITKKAKIFEAQKDHHKKLIKISKYPKEKSMLDLHQECIKTISEILSLLSSFECSHLKYAARIDEEYYKQIRRFNILVVNALKPDTLRQRAMTFAFINRTKARIKLLNQIRKEIKEGSLLEKTSRDRQKIQKRSFR